MRIMIKGGVWKNTEDEILKAAVMKYGKNQWARISSLLVRKSAKQCKARWYEWLDPSIKKTEWTREEDEKLLHLAKLMPTQWRTIAPIVGRTPSQCLERYEKLLDAACAKDENYEPGDDPRKLRPGEIDPNPESKPARPDPVDMDEDEKEMLSEARARLANTRGKKAKRKAREKQLEEARRLASLQKRRELKAAGIDNRHRKRKRKGIDYNAEIPFEKRPPPGFYDVTDESSVVEQPKFPTTIEELEGERRADKEARLRKQDVARNKIAQRQDAPSAILQANKMNDPETVRKRPKMNLPTPQIPDYELELIAKSGLPALSEDLSEGSGATRALLADYTQTPRQGMTPLRTPQRTPSGKQDAIMMEAENQARLRLSQTPLLGGENPDLHPSDFSGVTPKRKEIQTPNPILTPMSTPGPTGLTPRIGMTPRDGHSFGVTPKGTPIRDELHINEGMEMHDNAKLELRRQADMRQNLRSGLTGLPQPKNEYQIVVQPVPEDIEEPEEKMEEDMSDRMAREKAEEDARQLALLKKRSKVLQRELPRPPAGSLDLIRESLMRGAEDKSSFVPPTPIEQADEMIRKELLLLLEHDNVKYPLDEKMEKEKKKGKKGAGGKSVSVPVIEEFDQDELNEADQMIKEEAKFLRVAMGHEEEDTDEFVEAHRACLNDIMYFPPRNVYGLSSVAGHKEKLSAFQDEFENVKKKMEDDTRKAQRLEQKIKLLTNGYQMRAAKIWSQVEATFKQMDTAGTEYECFQALQRQEKLAASNRINSIWEDVQKQKELEKTLQTRYGDLLVEQERVYNLMGKYRQEAKRREEIAAAAANIEASKVAETESRSQVLVQVEEANLTAAAANIEASKVAETESGSQVPVQVEEANLTAAAANIEASKVAETESGSQVPVQVEEANLTAAAANIEASKVAETESVSQVPVQVEEANLIAAAANIEASKVAETESGSQVPVQAEEANLTAAAANIEASKVAETESGSQVPVQAEEANLTVDSNMLDACSNEETDGPSATPHNTNDQHTTDDGGDSSQQINVSDGLQATIDVPENSKGDASQTVVAEIPKVDVSLQAPVDLPESNCVGDTDQTAVAEISTADEK